MQAVPTLAVSTQAETPRRRHLVNPSAISPAISSASDAGSGTCVDGGGGGGALATSIEKRPFVISLKSRANGSVSKTLTLTIDVASLRSGDEAPSCYVSLSRRVM